VKSLFPPLFNTKFPTEKKREKNRSSLSRSRQRLYWPITRLGGPLRGGCEPTHPRFSPAHFFRPAAVLARALEALALALALAIQRCGKDCGGIINFPLCPSRPDPGKHLDFPRKGREDAAIVPFFVQEIRMARV